MREPEDVLLADLRRIAAIIDPPRLGCTCDDPHDCETTNEWPARRRADHGRKGDPR